MAALFLLAGTDHLALDAEMPKQSARVVTYTIHAKLVPESQTVLGKMEIVWRNTSSTPVGELYFHLYLNAFRDRESTFMKEGQGRGRSRSNWDEDHPGSVEIGSMKTSDGRELWNDESRAFVAPDDGNDKDRTLARVTLPSPVAPDETVHLAVEFTSELPRVFRRTGWSGDPDKPDSLFFMLAQWYPKLAVLRSREGKPAEWNRHQYHANTEFFAEYGVFQVHITVPEGFVVGATGVRTNSVSNGDGTVTHVHKQEDVHDFAWCASPGFVSREYEWEFDTFCNDADNAGVAFGDGPTMGQKIRKVLADTAARLGKELDDVKPEGKVTIKILVQRDHADLIDRFQWAAGASIACYGIWFGAYPYKVLTVMAPPNGGGAAGGMEYPTLITVWGNRLAPWYSTGMEGVTIHEFGHQYFYGLLGSNEFEEAWLDEGFTSFSDARCFEVAYGPNRTWLNYGNFTTPHTRPFDPPAVFPRFKRLLRLDSWLGQIPAPWKEPKTIVPDPGGSPFFDYVRDMPFVHFDKSMLIPQPLWERRSVLQTDSQDSMVLPGWEYARRADYRSNSYPKPTIFLYTLRGLMGEAAFDDALYTYSERYRFGHPTTDDFIAVILEKTPHEQATMVDGFMQAMIDTAAPLDVAILEASQTEREGSWVVRVKVQRRGQIPFPIQILGEDSDGTITPLGEWEHAARTTTKTFRFEREKPLRSVRVGPSWLRNIDGDITNNARFVGEERDMRASAVLSTRWTLYAEEILRTYVGMGR